MSERPVTAASLERAIRNTSAASALAHLFDVKTDRPKRIDQYVDYFGERVRSVRLAPRVNRPSLRVRPSG